MVYDVDLYADRAEVVKIVPRSHVQKMQGIKYILQQMEKVSRYSFRFDSTPNLAGNEHYEASVVRANPSGFDGRVLIVSREIDDIVKSALALPWLQTLPIIAMTANALTPDIHVLPKLDQWQLWLPQPCSPQVCPSPCSCSW